MKIAVYGNQCQDHKVEEIRALFEALRASGAFIEVERGFLEYVKGLIPDVAADKAVGDGEVSADVVVSIGGDGTFLRAAAWAAVRRLFSESTPGIWDISRMCRWLMCRRLSPGLPTAISASSAVRCCRSTPMPAWRLPTATLSMRWRY